MFNIKMEKVKICRIQKDNKLTKWKKRSCYNLLLPLPPVEIECECNLPSQR